MRKEHTLPGSLYQATDKHLQQTKRAAGSITSMHVRILFNTKGKTLRLPV
ncbi:hypothetical protein [Chitinophaga niastensis]|nr:hypothetical protein [Chitinophaga niastensis]